METVVKWFAVVVVVVIVAIGGSSASRSRRPRNLLRKDFRPTDLEYAPRWTLNMSAQPKLYMKLQHESVVLKCLADGRPKLNVTWLKDGRPITFDSRLSSPKYEKSRFGLRVLDLMSPFDRGNYTCIVSNRHGSLNHTYEVDVVVRLIGAPRLTNGPRNETVFEGEAVHMTCSYYSDMECLVYWLKHFTVNGSYVDSNGRNHVRQLQRDDGNRHDDTDWVIANVTLSDTGFYSCCARNVYGTICHKAWLQVVSGKRGWSDTETGSSLMTYLVLPVTCGVSLLVIVGALFLICFLRRRRYRKFSFKDPDVVNPIYLNIRPAELTKGLQVPLDEKWMIPEENLRVEALIGEGAFGLVYMGHVTKGAKNKQQTPSNQDTTVAVKILKESGTEEDIRRFLKEIEMMKDVGAHINVIAFLGCSARNGQLLLVVEFAKYGNLRDFLRARRNSPRHGNDSMTRRQKLSSVDDVINQHHPPSYEILVSFCYQAARGLEYLASKSIVHRDVACRNVLLADDLVVKIADFGLTRVVEGQGPYYQRNSTDLLPIRWMAPESLADNKYTTKSDVWSFGVLLWEVFSLGDVPYDATPVENLHSLLRSGYRLRRPSLASMDIYQTMTSCWKFFPQERPTFPELIQHLEASLTSASSVEYLLLDAKPETEAVSSGSDVEEDVFEQHDASSRIGCQAPVLPASRSGDSQYSSWSSDHTGSDASQTRLLLQPNPNSSR